MSEMKSNSGSDAEAYLRQLEQKQAELLQRIELAMVRLNGFLGSPAKRSGPTVFQDGGKPPATVEARLEELEALTRRWTQQSALTQARVEEILASRIWRSLTLVGSFLLRLTGGAKH